MFKFTVVATLIASVCGQISCIDFALYMASGKNNKTDFADIYEQEIDLGAEVST